MFSARSAAFALASLISVCCVDSFAAISYCNRGLESEHTHFSSHDIPSANGVLVRQTGPEGYACTTNDHPLVKWTKAVGGGRVELSIDIVPAKKELSDTFVKWIRAGRIEGDSARMPVGKQWVEKANAVMKLGNVDVVAADLASEKDCAWRHLSVIPAEGGMFVIVEFRTVASNAEAAESLSMNVGVEVGRFMSELHIHNPVVARESTNISTAWFVTPSKLVTCAHCTEGRNKFWFFTPSGDRVDLRLVDTVKKTDVSLLEIVGSEWRSDAVLSVADDIPRVAEGVWGLGYPLEQFVGDQVKYGDGVVSSHEGLRGLPWHFSVTMPIRPGASGGPVFNEAGKVCGMMDSTLKASLVYEAMGHVAPEFNYAVKVKHIRKLLERNGIDCGGSAADALPSNRPDAVESASRAVVKLLASKGHPAPEPAHDVYAAPKSMRPLKGGVPKRPEGSNLKKLADKLGSKQH